MYGSIVIFLVLDGGRLSPLRNFTGSLYPIRTPSNLLTLLTKTMSDLAHSQMVENLMPDTFFDKIRVLMHDIFNIPYKSFSYDCKYETVTVFGVEVELAFHVQYVFREVEGREFVQSLERIHLQYVFSPTKVIVYYVNDEGAKKVFEVGGLKEWTAVELFDLKKQLVQRFPLNLVVGPCIEGV